MDIHLPSVPIYKNFQSNGGKWPRLKLWIMKYPIKYFFFQSLRHGHLTPYDWKFLKIGSLRAKDLRKMYPVPPTLLVII